MALSVKNKIWLGTLFLFLLLLLTGGAGIYYTVQLKDQSKAILKDNYESLAYGHVMQGQLDSNISIKNDEFKTFDSALTLQEQNITEPGEQ
ncbi:MAG: PAS domain-containing sensor histidine kinase, partial [Flavisolibacter sp.]